MAEEKGENDFATILIEWYSKQKKAAKGTAASNKGEENVKEEA